MRTPSYEVCGWEHSLQAKESPKAGGTREGEPLGVPRAAGGGGRVADPPPLAKTGRRLRFWRGTMGAPRNRAGAASSASAPGFLAPQPRSGLQTAATSLARPFPACYNVALPLVTQALTAASFYFCKRICPISPLVARSGLPVSLSA